MAGYSYTFDSSDVGICGSVADLAGDATSVSSETLANGDYYFHLCTVDAVGNWSDAAVVGPYVVDLRSTHGGSRELGRRRVGS